MRDFIALLITAVSVMAVIAALTLTISANKDKTETVSLDSSWKCTKYYSNFQLIGKIVFYNDYCVQYTKGE